MPGVSPRTLPRQCVPKPAGPPATGRGARAGREDVPVSSSRKRVTAPRASGGAAGGRSATVQRPARARRPAAVPAVVVGTVSPLGRVAGVLALAAALGELAAPAFPLVVRSGGSGV